jgi:hypothetical protein
MEHRTQDTKNESLVRLENGGLGGEAASDTTNLRIGFLQKVFHSI